MAKITAETAKNWKFETKQLHVGQEEYDPVTDSRAVPIYQTTSFVFRNSKHADVSQTRQRIFLRGGSQHLRAESQHCL